MKYQDYENRIETIVEIQGVYDGWSIAVLDDGTMVNRWENDEGTGPEPGYERRYYATKDVIEQSKVPAESTTGEST